MLMIVKINMKDQGVKEIRVYEGDKPFNLAREFCI